MLIIGLTGGIGSGKSTVATRFSSLKVPIIDADVLAHELVTPGQPALQDIVNLFGVGILTVNGCLNRVALRNRTISNPMERIQLEAILHPRIRATIQLQLNQIHTVSYVILVVPLLFEAKFTDLCHRILVIDVAEAIQIERVQQRNGFNESEIRSIMNTQWNREQRIAKANDVITNDGSLNQLNAQIDALHEYYLSIGTTPCLTNLTYLNTH